MCNNSQPLRRTILEQSYTRPFHKFEQIEQKWKNKFKIFCQTDIGPVVEEDGGEEAGEGQAGQDAHGVRPEGVQPRQHRVHARTGLVGEKQLPEQ